MKTVQSRHQDISPEEVGLHIQQCPQMEGKTWSKIVLIIKL